VDVSLQLVEEGVRVEATVRTRDRTGVEMEALVAASVASLTVYDMCKAVDKGITITDIGLLSKTGGKSGPWARPEPGPTAERPPKFGRPAGLGDELTCSRL